MWQQYTGILHSRSQKEYKTIPVPLSIPVPGLTSGPLANCGLSNYLDKNVLLFPAFRMEVNNKTQKRAWKTPQKEERCAEITGIW
jgi:hypothetical protein